MAVLNVELF